MVPSSVVLLNRALGVLRWQLFDDFCTKHGDKSNIAINQYWESFSFQETFKAENVKTITARNPSTL